MQHKGFLPTAVTFTCALKACGSIGALKKGEEIHDDIVRQEMLNSSIALGNALVDMYSKCGEVAKAQCVLDELPSRNVTSWNALIAGYAQHGPYEDALKCYDRMWHEGLTPSIMTFIYVLKACGSIGAIDKGEEIHDEIVGQGLLNKDCVEVNACLCNALVDMYATCGTLLKAQHLLEGLHIRDVVSWNTIIGGYARQGKGEEALNCLNLMQRKGIPPDAITFTCILKACGSVGAADKGEGIHDEIVRQGLLEKDSLLGNALVDMYAKCGVLQKARQVLEALPVGDAVSWNALLGGYAQQGKGEDALDCFECMQHKGLAPNAITFSSMLNACSHSGLLEEGQTCFVNMCIEYGIVPELEHYSCMVDLFGRAGRFNKAVALIEKMPSAGYPTVWAALLGACRKWGDVSVARWAFEHAIEIDKSDTPFYVCMANIFAATTRQEDMQIDNNSSTVTNKTWRKGRGGLWNELCDSRTEFLDASLCHARTDYFDVKLPYLQVC